MIDEINCGIENLLIMIDSWSDELIRGSSGQGH